MGHNHAHPHPHPGTGSIRAAFFLNLSFTILEIIGGFWTNSLAILSDALHDLGDSFLLGLSWYLDHFSERGGDRRYSYGYRRFSLLAAFLNTLILLGGSLFILSEAVPRLLNPGEPNAQGMVLFAIGGILINGLAVVRLRRGRSMNAQVVAWHLMEDVLSWTAILIVSIVLLFWEINILDPILSIMITLYVLWNVFRNLRRTSALFLQAVPEDYDVNEIEQKLLGLGRVKSVHHTHIWSLDGEHHVLTTHVVVDECATKEEILQLKREINHLAEDLDLEHTTLEVEYEEEECRMREKR